MMRVYGSVYKNFFLLKYKCSWASWRAFGSVVNSQFIVRMRVLSRNQYECIELYYYFAFFVSAPVQQALNVVAFIIWICMYWTLNPNSDDKSYIWWLSYEIRIGYIGTYTLYTHGTHAHVHVFSIQMWWICVVVQQPENLMKMTMVDLFRFVFLYIFTNSRYPKLFWSINDLLIGRLLKIIILDHCYAFWITFIFRQQSNFVQTMDNEEKKHWRKIKN